MRRLAIKRFGYLVLVSLLLAGCSLVNKTEKVENTISTVEPVEEVGKKTYLMQEVSKHNREGDCWLVIEGEVYDVSGFVASHPGGKAILEGCGKEATELFDTRPMGSGTSHSERARKFSEKYVIGELEK